MLDDPRRQVGVGEGAQRGLGNRGPIGISRDIAGILNYVAQLEEGHLDLNDDLELAHRQLLAALNERDELAQRVFESDAVVQKAAAAIFANGYGASDADDSQGDEAIRAVLRLADSFDPDYSRTLEAWNNR